MSRSITEYLKMYGEVLKESSCQYDLVHANNGLTAPSALLQPKRPIVVSFWGSDLMGRMGWMSKNCARFYDERIVMSEEMASLLHGESHVIRHGIDLSQFQPIDQDYAQERVGWDPETAHVSFPYNPSRRVKNHPLAKRVVERVASTLSLPVDLKIVNKVPHEEIPYYMNAADVLLLTSRREGSPNAVKEAMACNLPVVATEVGDVNERLAGVRNSHVGRTESELVEYLITVLQDGCRSNGREHVQDLSLEHMGERILDVYEMAMK